MKVAIVAVCLVFAIMFSVAFAGPCMIQPIDFQCPGFQVPSGMHGFGACCVEGVPHLIGPNDCQCVM
ncbi:hypothetical protein ElyMa_001438300 [Elysia marginata]|uniref:Uncharacterized protein n=1 Tax=Elysia marginata TaxID=1093978 RepID=A0AAV4IXV0_9GAST|nr:hypothetical protein ElyMa_001438300 [Elysia marginata]